MSIKKVSKWSLREFKVPNGYRQRNIFVVVLWDFVSFTLFSMSPKVLYSFRNFLLKMFGAQIGLGVKIRPTTRISYPWNLRIGDYSWIGDYVDLYSLEEISIGKNSVISQYTKIITGSHDYSSPDFKYRNAKVTVGDNVWITVDCLLLPGSEVQDFLCVPPRTIVSPKKY